MGHAPLDGLIVADFSRVVAGPFLAMQLGDLGARVVKVEHPTGDDTRRWGPPWVPGGGDASYFTAVNRNKSSIALDLTDDRDRQVARRIAERADVVVENFRPGTMERFGLGYDDLAAANPAVVMASIDGFGDTDGARDRPGYDLIAQAASGLMSVTGWADGPPTKVGVAVVDVLAALYGTIGVLAAIADRHRNGTGRHVRVSLFDVALSSLINQAAAALVASEVPHRLGNDHPSIAPYSVFPTATDHVVIAVGNDEQFRRLCEVLGDTDLAEDSRFASNESRVGHRGALREAIEAHLARRPARSWLEAFRRAQVPAGPVNDVAQAFDLAAELGSDPVLTTIGGAVDPVPTVRSPLRFDPAHPHPASAPPVLDGDRAEVLAWLDLDRPSALG